MQSKNATVMKKNTHQTETIGDRIKIVLKSAGQTQFEAGQALGLSQSLLNGLISGRRKVQKYHLELITKTYNVDLEWLLTGKGNRGEIKALTTHKNENEGDASSHLKWLEDWIDRLNDEIAALRKDMDSRKEQQIDQELWSLLNRLDEEDYKHVKGMIRILVERVLSGEHPEELSG